jgi:hypothetical protein
MDELLSLEPRMAGDAILEPDVDFADDCGDLCLPITNTIFRVSDKATA